MTEPDITEQDITEQGISARFFANAHLTPDKLAVCCEEDKRSYKQLAQQVLQWSQLLTHNDVRHGEHVAVLLPNGIEFVVVMLVAADLGLVLVPLNTTLPMPALETAIQRADIKHIIASPHIAKGLQQSDLKQQGLWLSCGPGDDALQSLTEPSDLLEPLAFPVEESLKPHNKGQLSDPYILTMTSGSTAEPKPIVLSQQTKILRAEAAMSLYGVSKDDVVLAATPLYHSLAERLVLMPLLCGATSVIMNRYSAAHWLNTVEQFQITFTMAVSSQLVQIATLLSQNHEVNVSSLRCIVSSSAALEKSVKEQLLALLNCHFHECYGTSEIATVTDLNDKDRDEKLASVGKAIPGVDIKILTDDGHLAESGEVGEIICKTAMQFAGYYKQEKNTEHSYWQGYFRTGDLGFLDEDGYLYYQGRKQEVINSGGINVYPADVEKALAIFEGINECAVFAMPDEQLGEVVAAAIVSDNDIDERALRFHCLQKLMDCQQPRTFLFVDDLPKNAMGKLVRRELSRQLETV